MIVWVGCVCVLGGLQARPTPASRGAVVGADGVLRWQDDQSEVALFGVNYYVPFSIDHLALDRRGVDHAQAIREDVVHFERLGLTAIRLHCWDREISDREGNLLDNEHLGLLDLLVAECAKRGIYTVMTPIAWWGSPKEGGFSDLYTMHEMTTDDRARAAQCRYLAQFVSHVNRITGLAVKDDPAVVAIELINEPLYPKGTADQEVTAYVNALTRAVRSTGCRKPVFYNCWGGRAAAVGCSELDGVSFGWYPTGLASGSTLRSNYLARINDYPSMRDPALSRKAKIVYEFDAADVHAPYMYPAMARAFRSGGAQIATQFQYEPLCIAGINTNWQTHYLNLVYTPGKAMSFAIAAEAFRRIPRLAQFGPYPTSCRFGEFRVSFEEGLSEWVSTRAFMHSNTTPTEPPEPARLERVWGVGSSPVVSYDGTGAHFLDRIEPGVWKLQVYPDAVMVADPYTGGEHEKVRVLTASHDFTVRLPDLGGMFQVRGATDAGDESGWQASRGQMFRVVPGEYLLRRSPRMGPVAVPGPTYVAPATPSRPPAVFIDSPDRWREAIPYPLALRVAATDVRECVVRFQPAGSTTVHDVLLDRVAAYRYAGTVPVRWLTPGDARFHIVVRTGDAVFTFPDARIGTAGDELGRVRSVPLLGIRPGMSLPEASYSGPDPQGARARVVVGRDAGTHAVRIEAGGFGLPPSSASLRLPVVCAPEELTGLSAVTVGARGAVDTGAVEISLVQRDGRAFGADIPLSTTWRETTVPLARLRPMWGTAGGEPDPTSISHVAIVFGTWLFPDRRERAHAVEIQAVCLRTYVDRRQVTIAGKDDPVLLAAPAGRPSRTNGHEAGQRLVAGMDPGCQGVRVSVDGFGEEPDCTSWQIAVTEGMGAWKEQVKRASHLVIKARSGHPRTTCVEVVLVETDGSPWGVARLPLTDTWQAVRVPLADLAFFEHWPHPEGRGGPDDRLIPADIARVNVCFGAWLYGDERSEPHAFELQDVSLALE